MEVFALLFVLILSLIGAMAVRYFSSPAADAPKYCVGPHTWVLDQYEKLVCYECGFRPEQHQ